MGIQDDDDYSYLSDEERAALAEEIDEGGPGVIDDEDEDDDAGATAGAAGDADADAAAATADAAALDAVAVGNPGDDAAAVVDGAAAEAEIPGSQSFQIQTGDLAGIENAIAELKQARDDLEAAYDSGDSELTYAEHRAKLREVEAALLDLNAERAEIRTAQKINAAHQQEWWNREIRTFKREALSRDGVDYDKDPKLMAEWDKAVRYLGNDPDNANKESGWFLKEAHELVKARFKLGRAEPAEKTKAVNRVDEALAARRKQANPPPKTLSRLPEAGSESEDRGEFSYLDNLSGFDYENALARMPKDQQDRYLMG